MSEFLKWAPEPAATIPPDTNTKDFLENTNGVTRFVSQASDGEILMAFGDGVIRFAAQNVRGGYCVIELTDSEIMPLMQSGKYTLDVVSTVFTKTQICRTLLDRKL